MTLSDFYEAATNTIVVTITFNDETPDITSDTVTLLIKNNKDQSDADAPINVEADVVSGGAGIATFTLSKTDTAIKPGIYYYEIIWDLSTGERYILSSDTVKVLDSIAKV